jgi:hypothetical protein
MQATRSTSPAKPAKLSCGFQPCHGARPRRSFRHGHRGAVAAFLVVALTSLFPFFFVVPCALGQATASQQTPRRDQQALTLLNGALDAVGWHAGSSSPRDFTASGTITYFETNGALSGSATVRGRGSRQFRLDAQMAEGRRSIVLNDTSWELQEPSKDTAKVSYLDVGNLGILTFPYPGIAEAINDPTAWITYVGTTQVSGRAVGQVHVWRRLLYQVDESHLKVRPAGADYFIDLQTGLVLRTADATHPSDPARKDAVHELDFANYTTTGGVSVPMLVTERSVGQSFWELRLNSFNFNTGLTGTEFRADWQGSSANEK